MPEPTIESPNINPQLLAAFLKQMSEDTNEFKVRSKDAVNTRLLAAILPEIAAQNIVLNGKLRLDTPENGGSLVQNAVHRSMLIDSILQRYPNSLEALDPQLLELLALEQALAAQQAVPPDIDTDPQSLENLLDQLALMRSV